MVTTAARRSRYPRPECPFCFSDEQVVGIVYGEPDAETIELSRRREVALGGCAIGPQAENWYCIPCHRAFRYREPAAAETRR